MSHDDDDRDDALQALFDDTAPEDDPHALQRLARAAAQIPEGSRRRAPWWLLVPGLGTLIAAAAAAWMVMQPPAMPNGPVASGIPSPIPSAVPVPTEELDWFDGATASLWALGDDDDEPEELPAVMDDPLAVLDADTGGDPLGPLELLADPADDDLDLYLATYTAMLER